MNGLTLLVQSFGESQANHFGLIEARLVVHRDLGTLLDRIHRPLSALHHTVIDAVLNVEALVFLPEKSRSWFNSCCRVVCVFQKLIPRRTLQ